MDLFEQLRREHEFGIGTIAGVAAKFGVHRRVVRQALACLLRCRCLGPLRPAAAGSCGLRHSVIGPMCGERMMAALQDQAIQQHCKTLRMPTIGTQFARLADAAAREGQSHVGYLEALLAAEMEERESRAITRLLNEAKLPRMKTLEAFEFDRSGVSAAHLCTLAAGDYVSRAEPVLLVGEAGTGKTHLASGLCVAACRQRGGCGSPPRRRWSTNWPRRRMPTSSAARWADGSGSI